MTVLLIFRTIRISFDVLLFAKTNCSDRGGVVPMCQLIKQYMKAMQQIHNDIINLSADLMTSMISKIIIKIRDKIINQLAYKK